MDWTGCDREQTMRAQEEVGRIVFFTSASNRGVGVSHRFWRSSMTDSVEQLLREICTKARCTLALGTPVMRSTRNSGMRYSCDVHQPTPPCSSPMSMPSSRHEVSSRSS